MSPAYVVVIDGHAVPVRDRHEHEIDGEVVVIMQDGDSACPRCATFGYDCRPWIECEVRPNEWGARCGACREIYPLITTGELMSCASCGWQAPYWDSTKCCHDPRRR
jgi:hypothetical protein